MADDWSTDTDDWERYNDITTSNQSVSDLNFSDEQGNILVRFSDGGIKTKNFDSSQDATVEKRGLMSVSDKTKLNSIEQGAEVNDVKTSNITLSNDSDLDISDGEDNVLVRFSDGEIKTKKFDTSKIFKDVHYPTNYGAIYDGLTDCTAAIQKCLDLGGKIHFVGNGTALVSEALEIKVSNTHIVLDNGFTIKLKDNSNCSLIETVAAKYDSSSPEVGQHFIDNITIEGGTYDFNGNNQVKGSNRRLQAGFRIFEVNNFILRDVTLKEPCVYGLTGGHLNTFLMSNIFFDYTTNVVNRDGIQLNGEVYDGVIEHLRGKTFDDMVALNVAASDPGDVGIRKGNGKRITIRDIQCDGCFRAVRLLCEAAYTLDEITIDGVYGNYIRDRIINISDWNAAAKFGRISISNVYAKTSSSSHGGSIISIGQSGYECTVESLHISNVQMVEENGYVNNFIYTTSNNSIIKRFVLEGLILQKKDDVNLSSLNVIDGNGKIENAIVNNVIIDSFTNNFANIFGIEYDNLAMCNIIKNGVNPAISNGGQGNITTANII